MQNETTKNRWTNLMQPEFERGCHTEVATAAAQPPEKARVLSLACDDAFPIGTNQIHGDQVVTCETVDAHQPAEAAAERQTRNTRVRYSATSRCKTEYLRFAIEV